MSSHKMAMPCRRRPLSFTISSLHCCQHVDIVFAEFALFAAFCARKPRFAFFAFSTSLLPLCLLSPRLRLRLVLMTNGADGHGTPAVAVASGVNGTHGAGKRRLGPHGEVKHGAGKSRLGPHGKVKHGGRPTLNGAAAGLPGKVGNGV